MSTSNEKRIKTCHQLQEDFKKLKKRALKEATSDQEVTKILEFYQTADNLLLWRIDHLSRA